MQTTTGDVMAEFGIEVILDAAGGASGRTPLLPGHMAPGTEAVRASMFATWADMLAGSAAAGSFAPRLLMTLDLSTWIVGKPKATGSVIGRARRLKAGVSTVVMQTTFAVDAEPEQVVAVGHATFVASPRPVDESIVDSLDLDGTPLHRLERPVGERVGLTKVASGVVELPRRTEIVNPGGAIQGGLIALVAEEAALALGESGAWATSLDVKYLRAFREGAARATARWVAPSLARVEVVESRTKRLGAIAMVGVSND